MRGINRQTIFEDEKGAVKFLQTLADYKVYGYCLMENHIYLLFKEEKEELGIIMRCIGVSYIYWYSWKYNRCGHLFHDIHS
jgi:REP element-mobilizing transposase RayT